MPSTALTNLINLHRKKWVLKVIWSLPAGSGLICGHLRQLCQLKWCSTLPCPKINSMITVHVLQRLLDVQSTCHIFEKYREQTISCVYFPYLCHCYWGSISKITCEIILFLPCSSPMQRFSPLYYLFSLLHTGLKCSCLSKTPSRQVILWFYVSMILYDKRSSQPSLARQPRSAVSAKL